MDHIATALDAHRLVGEDLRTVLVPDHLLGLQTLALGVDEHHLLIGLHALLPGQDHAPTRGEDAPLSPGTVEEHQLQAFRDLGPLGLQRPLSDPACTQPVTDAARISIDVFGLLRDAVGRILNHFDGRHIVQIVAARNKHSRHQGGNAPLFDH